MKEDIEQLYQRLSQLPADFHSTGQAMPPEHFEQNAIRILELLDPKPGANVLEVGCSSGEVTRWVSARCQQLVAVDYCKDLVALAIERFGNTLPHVQFRQGNALDLAFPDNSFDCAFSNNLIHGLGGPAEAIKALQELRRVVKPGGRIVCSDVTDMRKFDIFRKELHQQHRGIRKFVPLWLEDFARTLLRKPFTCRYICFLDPVELSTALGPPEVLTLDRPPHLHGALHRMDIITTGN